LATCAAAGGEPGAARRRIGDDRHDLERAPCFRFVRAAARSSSPTGQLGLQPRALRGGARPRCRGLVAQGPFRWEGTHFQHRVVNPWARAAAEALPAGVDPRRS
jgi:hypothetical protein